MIPELARAYIESDAVKMMDNGKPLRSLTDFGYAKKIGMVQHIPVTGTLAQLTAYFRFEQADAPLGSTHFGIGRDHYLDILYDGQRFPVAETHQYMPIRRNATYPKGCSPIAQGAIMTNPDCPIAQTPAIKGMGGGVPNGAFHSVENVAWSGADGLTDAQFNANALLRAYCAGLDEYDITPLTQLWHSEIDQLTRCADPGWDGGLEEALQEAARAVLYENSPRFMRSLTRDEAMEIEPAPAPPAPATPPTQLGPTAKTTFSYVAGWANYAINDGPWEQCLREMRAWTDEAERLARAGE